MSEQLLASVTDMVGRLRARVRPADRSGGRTRSGSDPGEATTLYQCPACDTVYVALEKQTCSGCEVAVEQVPSTFTRSQPPAKTDRI